MFYYNITLYSASQDMTKIVTEFGKFIYNHLHMGMCALGDIFEAKVDELLSNIVGVKMCIDDILVLSKDRFEKHIGQVKIYSSDCALQA